MRLTARIIPVTPTHFPCASVSRLLQKFIPEKCRKRRAARITCAKCGTLYSSESTFSPSCSRKLRWYNWRLRGRDTRHWFGREMGVRETVSVQADASSPPSSCGDYLLIPHPLIIQALATSWPMLINNRRRKDIIRSAIAHPSRSYCSFPIGDRKRFCLRCYIHNDIWKRKYDCSRLWSPIALLCSPP